MRRVVGLGVLVLCAMFALGWGGVLAQDTTPAATPAAGGVTRDVLHAGYPEAAPGQVLELVRYTIQPGTRLPTHIHPGMQVAYIESGTLSYTVVEGTVEVVRAGADGRPGRTDTYGAGESTEIGPGDRFSEPEGMVHFGANRSDEPVVILVSSLFAAGEPPSHVIELATPAA